MPLVKVTREQWAELPLQLAEQGIMPADVTLPELCDVLGKLIGESITRGSFYSHFKTMEDLQLESIRRWLHANGAQALARAMDGIRDPVEQLRRLRAVAQPTLSMVMRNWAERAKGTETATPARAVAEAAEAVAEVRKARLTYATRAWAALGFPPAEARELAADIIRAIDDGIPVKGFERLLGIFCRAIPHAAAARAGDVEVMEGSEGQLIIAGIPRNSPEAGALRILAQQFATQHPPEGDHAAAVPPRRASQRRAR